MSLFRAIFQNTNCFFVENAVEGPLPISVEEELPLRPVNGSLNDNGTSCPHNSCSSFELAGDQPPHNESPLYATPASTDPHQRLPAVSQSPTEDLPQNNGWTESSPPSQPNSLHKETAANISKKRYSNSSLTAYQVPKLYGRKPGHHHQPKAKNGFVKMHSLGVQDMHDLVDELSLNSSINASIDSLSDSESGRVSDPPIADTGGAEATSLIDRTDTAYDRDSDNALDEYHHDEQSPLHRRYLLAKMNSPSPPPRSLVAAAPVAASNLPTMTSSQNVSDDEILSPLTERTTPLSHLSFDNVTETSMIKSDITVIPAPLVDSYSEIENSSLSRVPDPPPEFMNESNCTSRVHTGLWKGIAGCSTGSMVSNFIEPLLYLLSVSTDILCVEDIQSHYPHRKKLLLDNIVHPLRR